ncbi:hypothetical protein [Streptosporangium sp. NPDC048865]|uniref:hypothetical protein n=1 Tax=Streptosporangium sp. NPDC048865 TaxID=3155766 RepID=UPI0034465451
MLKIRDIHSHSLRHRCKGNGELVHAPDHRSFVSPLSDSGVPLENISRLVGHRNTSPTWGHPEELPGPAIQERL